MFPYQPFQRPAHHRRSSSEETVVPTLLQMQQQQQLFQQPGMINYGLSSGQHHASPFHQQIPVMNYRPTQQYATASPTTTQQYQFSPTAMNQHLLQQATTTTHGQSNRYVNNVPTTPTQHHFNTVTSTQQIPDQHGMTDQRTSNQYIPAAPSTPPNYPPKTAMISPQTLQYPRMVDRRPSSANRHTTPSPTTIQQQPVNAGMINQQIQLLYSRRHFAVHAINTLRPIAAQTLLDIREFQQVVGIDAAALNTYQGNVRYREIMDIIEGHEDALQFIDRRLAGVEEWRKTGVRPASMGSD